MHLASLTTKPYHQSHNMLQLVESATLPLQAWSTSLRGLDMPCFLLHAFSGFVGFWLQRVRIFGCVECICRMFPKLCAYVVKLMKMFS